MNHPLLNDKADHFDIVNPNKRGLLKISISLQKKSFTSLPQ